MQTIELRAWDVKRKEMIYIDDLYFFEEEGIHEIVDGIAKGHHAEYKITQYTGIKDKNDKKIFKGDIVKAWSTGSCGTFEVRWRQGGTPCFILYPAFQHGEMWRLHGVKDKDGNYYDDVEVVGNIYENPELIKN